MCVYSKCIFICAFRSCCNQEERSRDAGSGWRSDSDASELSAQLEISAHLRRGRVNHPSRPASRAPPDTAYLPSNKSGVQLESAARVSGCVSRWQNRLSCQSSCSEGRLITNTNNNVPAITINMLMTVINTAANGSAGITERARGLAIYSQTALINPQRGPSIKAPTLKSYQLASKTTLHCASVCVCVRANGEVKEYACQGFN